MLFYFVFSRWLWRLSIFRVLRLVNVPDLNGVWTGSGSTFRANEAHESKFHPSVTIRQNWTNLSIRFETEDSISHSQGGILLTEDSVTPSLTYHYLNEPKPSAPESMNTHRGTASLEYSNGDEYLTGRYYTNEARWRYGDIVLERQEKPSITSQLFNHHL